MRIDAQLSAKFAHLSFLASIMVLVQHMYAPYWSGWLETSVCRGLVLWDVPYFFFAAGFFLFGDFEFTKLWYCRKLKSRFHSLLLPYFCWHLWGPAVAVVSILCGLKPNTFNLASSAWWLDTLGVTAASAYCGHLWFFRRLMLFVILSPLIGWLARKRGSIFTIPVLWAMYVLNFRSATTWSNLSFFIMGAALSFRVEWIPLGTRISRRILPVTLVGYAVILFFMPYFWDQSNLALSRMAELSVIVFGFLVVWGGYEYCVRIFQRMNSVVFYSLFIYCVHNPLLVWVKTPVKMVLAPLHVPGIFGIVCSTVVMLILCLAMGMAVSRLLPRLFAVINGGRVRHV